MHDAARGVHDLVAVHARGDGVKGSVEHVEEQRGGGLDVDGGEGTAGDTGREEPGEHGGRRAMLLDGSGLGGGAVEDGSVQSSETQLELDEPFDLLIHRNPPVDGGQVGVAPGHVVAIGVEEMVTHRHQEVVPRREVAVEVALGRSRLGRDVLDPTVGRSSISQDPDGCVEKLAASGLGCQPTPVARSLNLNAHDAGVTRGAALLLLRAFRIGRAAMKNEVNRGNRVTWNT